MSNVVITVDENSAQAALNAAAQAQETANNIENYNLGLLKVTDTPPAVGRFKGDVQTAGTYTNFGGIVFTQPELDNNYGYIYVDDGVSSKVLSLKQKPELTVIIEKEIPLSKLGFWNKTDGSFATTGGYFSSEKYRTFEGLIFKNRFLGSGNAAQVNFYKEDNTFLSSMNGVVGDIVSPADSFYVAFTSNVSTDKIKTQDGFWILQSEPLQDARLTSLMTTKDDVVYNTLMNKINELNSTVEKITEKDEALFIEMATFTKHSGTPTNPTTLIVPTDTIGAVITGDFSAWGTTKIISAVVKYDDGSYEPILIKEFTALNATATKALNGVVVKISAMFNGILGQHLTELAYEAMGYYLYNQTKRTDYRYLPKNLNDFTGYTKDSALINGYFGMKNSLGERVLDFRLINSEPLSFVGLAPLSINYSAINTNVLNLLTNSVSNQGIGIKYYSYYVGFIEIIIGCDLAFGKGFLEVYKNNVLVKSYDIIGEVERLVVDNEVGDYEIRILSKTTSQARIRISYLNFFEKRHFTEPIFKNTDKILFLTDSWGEYPLTAVDADIPLQFNGQKRLGKSTMPIKFRELFVASGGNPDNVVLCTRGGFGSTWMNYWIDSLIEEIKPDKIVINTGINDSNSIANFPSTSSVYDFDPNLIFNAKPSASGGKLGSVDLTTFKNNLISIKNKCIKNGIKPVFFMMPKTAADAQVGNVSAWNKETFMKGF